MVKLPEPPSTEDLLRIGVLVHSLRAGTVLGRVYFAIGPNPITWDDFRYWGPTTSRFDHHLSDPSSKPQVGYRGILYASAAGGSPDPLVVSLAEVFQASRSIDLCDQDPWFALFATTRELRLLDLRGLWPTRAGASSAINSGPKFRAQRWSKAIYEAWPDLDGLIYPSSMGGNGDAVALYERAEAAIPSTPTFNRPLHHPDFRRWVYQAASAINYRVV